jgi:Lactate racemase N-terminal domain
LDLPKMIRVRVELESRALEDPALGLRGALEESAAWGSPAPGAKVAITAGSRGIDRIPEIIGELVSSAKVAKLSPVLVPAMGSHGGASPEGQLSVLRSLGITSQRCGAPIEASMETVRLGVTPSGVEVFMARAAMEADMIVAVNRVALHTGYSGPVQSGLLKMLAVGLGKVDGALSLHAHGFGAGNLIAEMALVAIEKAPVSFGVALIENANRELSHVEVIEAPSIAAREPKLLDMARSMSAAIPVSRADVLIVDEMGKEISGVGMDPHVTGRGKDLPPGEAPRFVAARLVVLSLSEGSGGNATGVGHADVTTMRLASSIDEEVTMRNVRTSGALHRARLPIAAVGDREAIETALRGAGSPMPEEARVVRIRNTARLDEMWVSGAVARELEGVPGVSLFEEAPFSFDDQGKIMW